MKKIYLVVIVFLSSISLFAQPSNDDACNPIFLTLNYDCSGYLPYDNTNATAQPGEPFGDCYGDFSVEQSVWFSFVAPSTGAVSINTDFLGSGMQDNQITVFDLVGGDCTILPNFIQVACNEDRIPFVMNTAFNAALPPFPVNPGQTYYIQVDGYFDPYYGMTDQGSFCIVVTEENPPTNDDCNNAEVYGGFGADCTKIFAGTTIGATASNGIDVLSCDDSEFNATVYYTLNTGVSEVEFNLLSGENVNVALFTVGCDGGSVEITGNCFTDLNASATPDPMDADVLFTNLTPSVQYLMAIWTDEGEATDFEFCLVRAPIIACGDNDCYEFIEDYANCPEDCPCVSSIDLYSYQFGSITNIPEAVCPEIVNDVTELGNLGLYIPFTIETTDIDLGGSLVTSTVGTLFTSSTPPVPLPNSEATNFLIYLFLTENELEAGGNITITFSSDAGLCSASITFNIDELIRPETSECGNCDLNIAPDYANAFCSGNSVNLTLEVENAIGPNVWISQDGNTSYNPGADIIVALDGSTNINFPTNDLTLTVYDEGNPNCAVRITFTTGDFTCSFDPTCYEYDGSVPTTCRLEPIVANLPVTCNPDGTLNIPIDIGSPTGAVTFNPGGLVSGNGTTDNPYLATIDINNCQPINLTISDESTCDETPIVTVNSPASIAGGIIVSTNANDWGIQIPYELGICGIGGAVTGTVAVVNDGDTAGGQLTDFCEPTPPDFPDQSVCDQIDGQIVLIDRGQCNFTTKVENAQNCGAIGVIICNCQPGPGWCAADSDVLITMAAGALENPITIPAVFMLYADCQEIKAELNNGSEVEICIGAPENIVGCERDLVLDVCNNFSTGSCDDGDCSTENDVATIDNSGSEICACEGTAIQCPAGETFNNNTCLCESDDPTTCSATIDELAPPAQTNLCSDASDLPTFNLPTASLPNIEIIVEVNGTIAGLSNDGSFDASSLNIDDEVCYTAFAFDLAAVQNLLDITNQLCPTLDILFPDLMPCFTLSNLANGSNDGTPGINNAQEVFDFVAVFTIPITSVNTAATAIETLNQTFLPLLGLDETCYANSTSVCLSVIDCGDCEEDIAGSITSPDPLCDLSGINIIITAPDGTSTTVASDAAGNFTLPNGPYPCGNYTAEFEDISLLPTCYSNTGSTAPISFNVDGNPATDDGPNFMANPTIPTLSQWGLIMLALLLMTWGALILTNQSMLPKINNQI